jgi:hypothetical protein
MLRKTVFVAVAALSSSALAVPLTRYFPDNALAVIEAKDLQEAVGQTGSFGEDTQKFLTAVLGEALNPKSDNQNQRGLPFVFKDLTVRAMVGSIRDVAVGAYSVNGNPEFLGAIRLTPKNLIVNAVTKSFNDFVKRAPAKTKLREGNYIADISNGMAVGVGNNIFYVSTNADVLRGYLRRLNGQQLPVITGNPSYAALNAQTGDGFLKQMVQFSAIAQMLQRDKSVPKKFLSALKTLNTSASASSIVADGMETRSVTQLNPSGGDPALYKVLTYAPEKLDLLNDLPSSAPSANVIATDTSGWLDYMQSWLPELGFSARNNREVLDTLSSLKDRLGNEWAVVNSNLPNNSLASSFGLGLGGVSASSLGLLGAGFLGDFASPNSETVFYAKTKNGAGVLTDLEIALKDALKPGPAASGNAPEPATVTVERNTVAGFDALVLKTIPNETEFPPKLELWIVNKRDTVIIGSDQAKLEEYINDTPLLENPLFQTFSIPAKISGVQFVSPIELGREEIDTMIQNSLRSMQLERDVSSDLVTAFGDWFESWVSRTQGGYGYSLPQENILRSYSKTGFAWNQ